MRVYLDMCCLKRPFDDQTQPRIRIETEAVLAILAAPEATIEFITSPALALENDQNPVRSRAAKVQHWLDSVLSVEFPEDELETRTGDLIQRGFKNFDAFHVACAELGGAKLLCTCDDRFLATANRYVSHLKVRVVGPLELVREILP
jgi:PIN domain